MQEDLIILLEWLNANGIDELFDDKIEEKHDIIRALANQQTDLIVSSFNKLNDVKDCVDDLNDIDSILDFVNNTSFYNNFRKLANNSIVIDGDINSKILIVNDIPNDQDDISGKIFSGNDGILLRNAFNSVGINNYCLLNTFFWRLPGNRAPIREELEVCKPVVEKIISLLKPKIIILTGNYSSSTLIENNKTLLQIRGKTINYTNCYMIDSIVATGMYNPNFLLKNTSKKQDFWKMLLNIRKMINY